MTAERLKLVVADHERPARKLLANLLKSCPGVDLVGEASSGAEAVSVIHARRPNLAFVDLQLPEVGGLDVARRVSGTALVTLVTAFDGHALDVLESNAVDYLLKPVQKERLVATLDRARHRLEQSEPMAGQELALTNAATAFVVRRPYADRLPLRQHGRVVIVPVRTIASIVADGEILHIKTVTHDTYSINHRLTALEARLDPRLFIRLGRGTLVNLERIAYVRLVRGGTCIAVLDNGEELAVSRIHSRALRSSVLKL